MNPLAWYRDNGIRLHAGVRATCIDRDRGVVVGRALRKDALAYSADAEADATAQAIEEPYDDVIIATGSRPFVPPMEGFGGPGTFLFRTIDDCARIADCARENRRAAVIGGGLLGLEAARGLLTHGVEVTVVEAAPQLMVAQLDPEAGDMLRKTIEGMGIRVLCNTITSRIAGENGRVTGLVFTDGSTLDADMVVVSTGIRPITEIAAASGLTVTRGIVCDDQMRTSDPAIFAVGECVEHRGQLYGLVDPIWEQANVLADVITGVRPGSAYHGSKLGTKLKVMGVELASMGATKPADADDEVIVYREPRNGIYKKLIVRNDQITGAILLGDVRPGQGRPLRDMLSPLGRARVWRFGLYYVVVFGAYVALSAWLPKFYIDTYRVPLATAAILTATFIIPASLLRPLGGYLADRWGPRGVTYGVFIVMTVVLVLLSMPSGQFVVDSPLGAAGAPLTLTYRLGLGPFGALMFVLGCAMGIGKASVYKYIPDYFPRHVGAVGGIVGMLGALGGFFLPPSFGLIGRASGIPQLAFTVLLALTLCSLAWLHLVIRRLRTSPVRLDSEGHLPPQYTAESPL